MTIKFGPAGIGGVKEAIGNLEKFKSFGFEACEIAFTYGIYIKTKEDAVRIGNAAEKLGIQLSIHAPYWINLNSEDSEKVHKSKERILKCCEIGHHLKAYRIVFHPGYYSKRTHEETYNNIRDRIQEIQDEIKKNKWEVELAPETTGKVNVFGSTEEIARLVRDTKCKFCIDFSHILARYKKYNFEEVLKNFESSKKLHIHFSGIEYGEKGEKKHLRTPEAELKKLISALPRDKEIIVISESPSPIEDSVLGLDVYRR